MMMMMLGWSGGRLTHHNSPPGRVSTTPMHPPLHPSPLLFSKHHTCGVAGVDQHHHARWTWPPQLLLQPIQVWVEGGGVAGPQHHLVCPPTHLERPAANRKAGGGGERQAVQGVKGGELLQVAAAAPDIFRLLPLHDPDCSSFTLSQPLP
jgi:hypothetical protein